MRGGVGCQAAEPSERVDLDLGKVSSGRAGVGRGLVSVGNENCAAAAVLVGGIADNITVGFPARGIFQQQRFELLRRFQHGTAGDINCAAGVAAIIERIVCRVALREINAVRGDGEFFCGNILQRGNRAAAMVVDVAVEARRAVLFKLGRDGAPVKTARIVA